MIKRMLITGFLCTLMLSTSTANADVIFNFEFGAGADGWSSPDVNVSWQPAGGNPTGYMRKNDNVSRPIDDEWLYAPLAILGDWSAYNSIGTISFDHRIFATGDVAFFIPYQIELIGASDSAIWSGDTATGITNWVANSARLDSSEWNVTGDWSNLLSNVDVFRVRIETVSNSSSRGDISGLDNISLTTIPEPSAAGMLCLAFALLGLRRSSASR